MAASTDRVTPQLDSDRCVFPDSLLNLEERLHPKIKQASAAVGVGEIRPEQSRHDIDFAETREEIARIRREDPTLFERGGTSRGALSGEEYRQELRQAVEQGLRERIEQLPWGSGSGMTLPTADVSAPGYVFCVRVADWKQPLFRYVGPDDGGAPIAEPSPAWTVPAHATGSTPRESLTTKPTAKPLTPGKPPAPMSSRSGTTLPTKPTSNPESHQPSSESQDQVDRAIDTLHAPYPQRTIRTFRAAIRSTQDPVEQARKILEVIDNLGLEPYVPPKPLPEITPDDVHLVCWLALVPQ